MARYDASIIREYADHLYSKADLTIIIYTIGGGLIGWFGGSVVGDTGASLVGAIILTAVGYHLGHERAFGLKLQAQIALCQVKIEENTRRFEIFADMGNQRNKGASTALSANPAQPATAINRPKCPDCLTPLPDPFAEYCPRCSEIRSRRTKT